MNTMKQTSDFVDLTDVVRGDIARRRRAERVRNIATVLATMFIAVIIWLAGVGAGWLLFQKADFTEMENARFSSVPGNPKTTPAAHPPAQTRFARPSPASP